MSKVNIVCANYDLLLNRCKLGIETLWGACVEGYNCPKYKAEMPSEIEEMALELCRPRNIVKMIHNRTCDNCDTSACDIYELGVDLDNAGYRNQSEKMVEVVRCCDCKYCEAVINDIIDEPKYFCTRLVGCFPTDPTDYCSRAVKKGGE
jgi:hypothetical protein